MAMYIGDLYIRMNAGTSAVYYSPTFSRGGLAATFLIDLFNLMGKCRELHGTLAGQQLPSQAMGLDSLHHLSGCGTTPETVSRLE